MVLADDDQLFADSVEIDEQIDNLYVHEQTFQGLMKRRTHLSIMQLAIHMQRLSRIFHSYFLIDSLQKRRKLTFQKLYFLRWHVSW